MVRKLANSVVNNNTMTQLVSFQTAYPLYLALDCIGLVGMVVLDLVQKTCSAIILFIYSGILGPASLAACFPSI